jgi:TPR repeat protein
MKWITSAAMLLSLCIVSAAAEPMSREQIQEQGKRAREAWHKGDHNEAYRLLLPLAEAGDALAQFTVGIELMDGTVTVVPPDQRQALGLEWIRKAASAGLPQAMRRLHWGYKSGLYGLPRDAELAECYLRADLKHTDLARISALAECSELEHAKDYAGQR